MAQESFTRFQVGSISVRHIHGRRIHLQKRDGAQESGNETLNNRKFP